MSALGGNLMSAFQLLRMLPDHLRTTKVALTLTALVASLTLAIQVMQAQTFTVLYTFHGTDGLGPIGELVRDSRGTLYGTTVDGGGGPGTVFKLDKDGKQTVLHHFSGGGDGGSPFAGVVRDVAGNLYGTTESGGSNGYGVVFKLDPKGHETVLHSFVGGKDGAGPVAPLVLDAVGNVYGTTFYGGRGDCGFQGSGCGVVFKLSPAGKETVLHRFLPERDGSNPLGGLFLGSGSTLYGTTAYGSSSAGIVFRLNRHNKETILYGFGGGADGAGPAAGVIKDAAGNLYGTTREGGRCYTGYCGVIFKVDARGHETVLYHFYGRADGQYPTGRLLLDKSENLYGTTENGGDFTCATIGCGVVFRLRLRDRKFTVLHTFTGKRDGSYPDGGLILDSAGTLYGVAALGGDPKYGGSGTVFSIKP
jgi:uncharacterized repeat protein (TIGR03803 family)